MGLLLSVCLTFASLSRKSLLMVTTTWLSRRPRSARSARTAARTSVAAVCAVLILVGCSSPSGSDTGPTATAAAPTSAASGSGEADCSAESIASALPGGSEVVKFDCADVSGTEWAAASVSPGPTVFFLQWSGGAWKAETSDEVCGTASAGLPEVLLSYCQS